MPASCAADERSSRTKERRTFIADRAAELLDLRLSRVLAERTKEVAELRARDVRRAALVKEREGLADLGGSWWANSGAAEERAESKEGGRRWFSKTAAEAVRAGWLGAWRQGSVKGGRKKSFDRQRASIKGKPARAS